MQRRFFLRAAAALVAVSTVAATFLSKHVKVNNGWMLKKGDF